MNTINKAKKDMIDLEAITKNIDENYKPINIKLTSYEQEQEDNAIISYEELLKQKTQTDISYDDSYIFDNEKIDIKKIDLEKEVEISEPKRLNISLMNYEKEEEFLRTLRKLQENLAR